MRSVFFQPGISLSNTKYSVWHKFAQMESIKRKTLTLDECCRPTLDDGYIANATRKAYVLVLLLKKDGCIRHSWKKMLCLSDDGIKPVMSCLLTRL